MHTTAERLREIGALAEAAGRPFDPSTGLFDGPAGAARTIPGVSEEEAAHYRAWRAQLADDEFIEQLATDLERTKSGAARNRPGDRR